MASEQARAASKRRSELRDELFPAATAWVADDEIGFFRAPRTLPLLAHLISSKRVSGEKDASSVYLELWARNWGEGIVMITDEADHAFAAGYTGTRAIRTWRERIRLLEEAGFIQVKAVGNRTIGAILMVHPSAAVERLRQNGRVDDSWWNAYAARRSETGEKPHAKSEVSPPSRVLSLKAGTKKRRA